MEWPQIYERLLGDRESSEAWNALWQRVMGWARRGLWQRGWYAIEDVVEETCSAALMGIEKAQGPGTFSGFVYGHYLNARKRVLHGAPTESLSDEHAARLPADPDDGNELPDEGRDALQHCLDTLAERERQAVQLRYFDEASAGDVADALGVSAVNGRQIVFRALAHLRECMGRFRPD
jgi:RNA polymerase sigma factor (sigma-70 family)